MGEREQLKRAIGRLERGRGRRYPTPLRERIDAYVAQRRSKGASWARIGDELDVPWETLRRWSRSPRASTSAMVPVEVVAPPVSDDIVAVVSPSGWRLEGLDMRDAVAVLRALS